MSVDGASVRAAAGARATNAPRPAPARPAWRRALALVARARGRAGALYRRWDAHQERLLALAAEADNARLLFPPVWGP